jgi:hypothetical protein
MKEKTGTWVGLDRNEVVQAGHVVFDPDGEDEAREFVTGGGLTALRVGPDVRVRLGFPLPQNEET